MIPPRLPPFAHSLPATSASSEKSPSASATADNTMAHGTGAQTPQASAAQSLQAGLVTGTAAASGRKRPLPLLPTPRAIRPRINAGALPAALATSPRSHAALQRQTQITQAIAAALDHFGMAWNPLDEQQRQALVTAATHLSPAPYHLGMTATALRQQQLHAVLAPIQTAQDMARFAGQRQFVPQVIAPAMLAAPVSAVHYGGVTIEGPDLDHAGQRCFYLEQQCGHACAQHAVNAMVGGPLVSLAHFAHWEANAQAQQESMPAPMTHIVTDMLAQGVHPETVHGTLQGLEIPMHLYVHRPINNAQGLLMLDPAQAHFLDNLETDRLLLQADRYAQDGTTSHYVAFRRDGGQWVLLDSLHGAPQYGIAPSDYLLRNQGIKHFTAIWPQHALRGRDTAVDGDGSRPAPPFAATAASAAVAPWHERTPSLLREDNVAARAKAPQGQPAGAGARSEIQRKFLAGLAPYAAGKSLQACQSESGLAGFYSYLSAAGGLAKKGKALYDKLPQQQQNMVDEAIKARRMALLENAMFTESVTEQFLAGLAPYAAGKNLLACEIESGLASFHNYLSAAGGLPKSGKALYGKLPQERKAEVDEAIKARQMVLLENAMSTESVTERFLAGLAPYAAGKSLQACQSESGLAGFYSYLSAAGGLAKQGKALYDKLPQQQQNMVDAARLSRTVWFARENIDGSRFLDAIQRFSTSSMPIEALEQATGLKTGHLALLLSDSGLTEAGRKYVEKMFDMQTQEAIERAIAR